MIFGDIPGPNRKRQGMRDRAPRATPPVIHRHPIPIAPHDLRFIKAPSGGIPARVASVLGTASCSVYRAGADDLTLEDTTVDIDVYNWGVEAGCVNGERYGIAGWWAGQWWLVSEDCADDQEGTVASRSLTVSTTTPVGTFGGAPSAQTVYGRRVVPKFTIPLGLTYSA